MAEMWQWVICGLVLLGALVLIAWRMGWLSRGSRQVPSCGTACPKCGAAEEIAKRLENL